MQHKRTDDAEDSCSEVHADLLDGRELPFHGNGLCDGDHGRVAQRDVDAIADDAVAPDIDGIAAQELADVDAVSPEPLNIAGVGAHCAGNGRNASASAARGGDSGGSQEKIAVRRVVVVFLI